MIFDFLRRLFDPNAPLPTEQGSQPASMLDAVPPAEETPPEPGMFKIMIGGQPYWKRSDSPFWPKVAKMEIGSFVKYESVRREWHVFRVVEGVDYRDLGGPIHDLSVRVERVSTRAQFTMPCDRLDPCEGTFAARDGTKIRPGESWKDR